MFRITGLRLTNICQHAALTTDIKPGLTAVIGRNGSGKTSLLRALVYGLTGLVDGSWGSQQSLQKDGSVVVGSVEVDFTDGSETYTVKRCAAASPKFPDVVFDSKGNTLAQRRQKVNEYMETVFGMPCPLMFQVCWGRQGELASLLKATPATVSTFLSQVFDTKQLEKIREKLKLQLDTIAQLPSSCGDSLQADKEALEALLPESQLQTTVDALSSAHTKAANSLQQLLLKRSNAISKEDYESAKQALEERLADLQQALAELNFATSPAKPEDSLQSLQAQLSEAERKHSKLTQSSLTCSFNLKEIEGKLEATNKELEQTRQQWKTFTEQIKQAETHTCMFCGGEVTNHEAYKKAMLKFAFSCEDLEKRETSQQEKEQALQQQIQLQEETKASLKSLMAETAAGLEAAETTKLDLAEKINAALYWKLTGGIEDAKHNLETLNGTQVLDENLAAAISRAEAEVQSTLAKLNEARNTQIETRANRILLERAIEASSKLVKQAEINTEARRVLSFIRDALSQPRAQARYLRTRIERLNLELARYLTLTGMPFSLKLDPDSRAFVFTTPEGVQHPASHLSGAQQAMSAVALQMALFAVMQPNLNLYLIDEPTESLDDGNKATMADMFAKMQAMLPSVEGTMLIVTRDEPVIASCGNTIEVTGD